MRYKVNTHDRPNRITTNRSVEARLFRLEAAPRVAPGSSEDGHCEPEINCLCSSLVSHFSLSYRDVRGIASGTRSPWTTTNSVVMVDRQIALSHQCFQIAIAER